MAEALEHNRERIDQQLRGWRSGIREATKSTPGQLIILRQVRITRDDSGERIGPRGFGSGNTDTVPDAIGPFIGEPFVRRDFATKNALARLAVLLPHGDWEDEDTAFSTIAAKGIDARISTMRNLRSFAVEGPKLAERLDKARRFFTPEAISCLARWGADRDAPFPFTLRIREPQLEIKHNNHICRCLRASRLPHSHRK